MAYCLAVKWIIKEGDLEPVLAALRPLVEASRQEPGCLLYQAHRDPENENVIFLYEQYADEAAYQAHADSEHFKRYALDEIFPNRQDSYRAVYETLEP
jgi:quinol monooxygenase YgiN